MLQFIMTHIDTVLIVVSGIVTGASAVAALTPTPLDDCLLAKARKWVDLLALNIGNAQPASTAAE